MMKFVFMLIGIPLIALSLVITITILKTGWNILHKEELLDSKSYKTKKRYSKK